MTQFRNPFIFGGPVPPAEFFGRQDTVHFMMDRLYGRSRSSVAIWGDRRVGKTSLLYYLAHPANREQWGTNPAENHMVFVDCQLFNRFNGQNFWSVILEESLLSAGSGEWRGRAEELLQEQQVSERSLRFWLRTMQQEGHTLTLLLDEFELLVQLGLADNPRELQALLSFLRTQITDVNPTSPHPRPLALVVASRRPLDEICRPVYGERDRGSPFHNPFVYERLKPFSQPEVRGLLTEKLASTDITFSEYEVNKLLTTVGRHPLLIQAYASELFMAKVRGLTDYRTTILNMEFINRNLQHFQDLWWYSSPAEREFMTKLLRQQLTPTLSISEQGTQSQLLERGLLERVENQPLPSFFSALFAQWLGHNLDDLLVSEWEQPKQINMAELRKMLIDRLSETDFKNLCFDLAVDMGVIEGDDQHSQMVSFLRYLQRRDRVADLLAWLHKNRPDLGV